MGFRVKVGLYDKLLSIFLIFSGQEGSSVGNSTLIHTHTLTHSLTHSLSPSKQSYRNSFSLEAEARFN